MKHSLSIPLMIFAALLVWTLLTPRETLLRPALPPPEAADRIPDSYASEVTSVEFGARGEPLQRTGASRLRRFETEQVVELDAPQRENFGDDGSWVATAARGLIREGAETLQLDGSVVLDFSGEGARLSSESMLINLRHRSARSLAPVLLEQGESRISAPEMLIALDMERAVLSGGVQSTYAPDAKLLTLLLLATSAAPGALALPEDRRQAIEISASRAVRDERAGMTVYSGNVILEQGSLHIEADRLTIFHDREDADRIVAVGAPARLRQRPAVDQDMVNAHAGRIVYFKSMERVLLSEAASIEQGGATVTGESIEYLMADQRVRADASDDDSDRVQVVIPAEVIEEQTDGGNNEEGDAAGGDTGSP